MRKLTLALLLSMFWAGITLAETIDGITFTLDASTSTATVTSTPSGSVVIPSTVKCNDRTYIVTAISGVSYSGINSIEIPSTVKRIEKGSFRNRESLIEVILSEGLNYIGDFAFEGCNALPSITIPTTVTFIGEGAFRDCTNLSKIVWNAKNCADFTSASNAPFNYRRYGYAPHEQDYRNYYTTSIIFGDEVEYIPAYLCYNFTAISTLVIPHSVKEIGNYAFYGFYHDDSENNRYDSNLTSVTFGNRLEKIGLYAFYGRRSLDVITIPNYCTFIGNYAFGECNRISSITLGKNISTIGTSAFTSGSIGTINIYAATPPVITRSVFPNVHYFNLITLNVPSNAIDAYKTATVWKDMSVKAMSQEQHTYTLSVSSSDESMGTTSLGGDFDEDSEVIIYAQAKNGYKFSKWNDGNTNNPRTVKMISNLSFVAYFEVVTPDDPNPDDNPDSDDPEPVADPDTDISSMNNVIYLNKVEASADSQINLSIRMKNTAAIRGFQFDIYLPEDVTVVKSAKGKIIGSLSDGRLPEDDEHSLTLSEQGDGAIRFLCGSLYDETFTGNDGEIAILTVKIAEDISDGEHAIILRNIKLTETDINNYYQTDYVKSTLTVMSYTLGDINSDHKVDVSDYIGIANHILGNTPEGFVMKAADVNEDGLIDVSDYIGVANIILTGSIYGSNANAPMMYFEEDVNQEVAPN